MLLVACATGFAKKGHRCEKLRPRWKTRHWQLRRAEICETRSAVEASHLSLPLSLWGRRGHTGAVWLSTQQNCYINHMQLNLCARHTRDEANMYAMTTYVTTTTTRHESHRLKATMTLLTATKRTELEQWTILSQVNTSKTHHREPAAPCDIRSILHADLCNCMTNETMNGLKDEQNVKHIATNVESIHGHNKLELRVSEQSRFDEAKTIEQTSCESAWSDKASNLHPVARNRSRMAHPQCLGPAHLQRAMCRSLAARDLPSCDVNVATNSLYPWARTHEPPRLAYMMCTTHSASYISPAIW